MFIKPLLCFSPIVLCFFYWMIGTFFSRFYNELFQLFYLFLGLLLLLLTSTQIGENFVNPTSKMYPWLVICSLWTWALCFSLSDTHPSRWVRKWIELCDLGFFVFFAEDLISPSCSQSAKCLNQYWLLASDYVLLRNKQSLLPQLAKSRMHAFFEF